MITAAAGLILSMALFIPAFAQSEPDKLTSAAPMEESDRGDDISTAIPYPIEIQLVAQGDRNYLHKTFMVEADYDPDRLVEAAFSQGGYRYRFREIIQKNHTPGSTEKTASEGITLETDTDATKTVLSMFQERLPYLDDEGYHGDLFLVPESLHITEAGRSPYSYTVSETRKYFDLSRNDPSLIPKTIITNGMTLSLQGIDWQVVSSNKMGYSDVPTGYTASATYTGIASGTKVSGYIASVTYSGEVVKQLAGKSTYTIIYEGEQIVIPFNYIPLLLAGLVVVGCIVLCVVLWKNRKNVEIYTMQQGEPVLYAKERVKPNCPVIDMRNVKTEARVVLDRRLQKQLMEFDSTIVVRGCNKNYAFSTNKSRTLLIPAPMQEQVAHERSDFSEMGCSAGGTND
jgi:hypothetical protein